MRNNALVLAFLVAFAPASVLAGPNAGGVPLTHAPGITYAGGNPRALGTAPDSCGAVVSEIDDATGDSLKVWKVYAAFPAGPSPRLRGITFGIDYDDAYGDSTAIVIAALGPCAEFQLPMNGWPGDSTGTSILWGNAQTGPMTEVYGFAGYNYYSKPASFALIPHPEQGGYFIDDSRPGRMDPIADYGAFRFGVPGYVPSCGSALQPNQANNPGSPPNALPPTVPPSPEPCAYPMTLDIPADNYIIVVSATDSLVFSNTRVTFSRTDDDTVRISGHPILPLPYPPPPESTYQGAVQGVPMAVALHSSGASWRQAAATVDSTWESLETAAKDRYRELLQTTGSASAASLGALSLLKQSSLIDSARTTRSPRSPNTLRFRIRGVHVLYIVRLGPADIPHQLATHAEAACDMIETFRAAFRYPSLHTAFLVKGSGFRTINPPPTR